MNKTILLVEDDAAICEMLRTALVRVGFMAEVAENVNKAEKIIPMRMPHLILLDWMLPGISGIDFVRQLRRDNQTKDIPIIMLTARSEEADRLFAFEAGADDYVRKPYSVKELIARIKAVLRRTIHAGGEEPLIVDDMKLDPVSHRVTCSGDTIKMGPTDFRLLYFFMVNEERAFARQQLLARVWGNDALADERTVDVHIRRLRKALSEHGYDRLIQTVHGIGYRFSKYP